ncbi:hypothetical protein Tco_0289270, partial [Tanacetum coccineum]
MKSSSMTFEQRSSSLVLHQMTFEQRSSSLVLHPMTPRSSMFKRRLIAADQASVFMAMTSFHISSSLVLHQMMSDHNSLDLAPQRQEMASAENNTSGP